MDRWTDGWTEGGSEQAREGVSDGWMDGRTDGRMEAGRQGGREAGWTGSVYEREGGVSEVRNVRWVHLSPCPRTSGSCRLDPQIETWRGRNQTAGSRRWGDGEDGWRPNCQERVPPGVSIPEFSKGTSKSFVFSKSSCLLQGLW